MTVSEARKQREDLQERGRQASLAYAKAMEEIRKERVELQRSCPHENTTSTRNRFSGDVTACIDCGKRDWPLDESPAEREASSAE